MSKTAISTTTCVVYKLQMTTMGGEDTVFCVKIVTPTGFVNLAPFLYHKKAKIIYFLVLPKLCSNWLQCERLLQYVPRQTCAPLTLPISSPFDYTDVTYGMMRIPKSLVTFSNILITLLIKVLVNTEVEMVFVTLHETHSPPHSNFHTMQQFSVASNFHSSAEVTNQSMQTLGIGIGIQLCPMYTSLAMLMCPTHAFILVVWTKFHFLCH